MAKLIKIKGPRSMSTNWYSDFEWGGKRIRRALSPDKRIAQKKLEDLLALRYAERHGTPVQDISWEGFVGRYETYSKAEKSFNTNYRDVYALKLLQKTIGIQYLRNVTPESLDRAKCLWKERGLKVPAINRHLTAIKAAMRKAEEWGYVKAQGWRTVKAFKTPKGRLDFYTLEEVRKLKGNAKAPWDRVVMLGARAGLRRGEIFHLDWADIDFGLKRIHIVAKSGWEPKDHERRWIPMSKDLQLYMEGLPERQGLVFRGVCSRMDTMTHMYKKVLKKSHLRGSLHTLRHTFGSHLAMAGVPLSTIARYMGHASTRTTEIYAHLQEDHLDKEIHKIPELSV